MFFSVAAARWLGNFARDFRDGKITLATFLEGPEPQYDPLVELEELLGDMLRAPRAPKRARSKSRRPKR
jgi:hypothetical protein